VGSLRSWRYAAIARWSLSRVLFAFLLFHLSACLVLTRAAAAEEGAEKLQIVTASGVHDFSVEVMRTPAELEKGLMFRKYLPQDRGMLFVFATEEPVAMWMKNTYLPLDMIFIGRTGRVVGLAENAEPLSEKIIPSGAPTAGVLEVNAGIAAKIGLKIGDLVRHSAFMK